jgi:hypothetical protein
MANYEIVWEEESAELNGVIGIWDQSQFGLSHLMAMGPRTVHRMFNVSYVIFTNTFTPEDITYFMMIDRNASQ